MSRVFAHLLGQLAHAVESRRQWSCCKRRQKWPIRSRTVHSAHTRPGPGWPDPLRVLALATVGWMSPSSSGIPQAALAILQRRLRQYLLLAVRSFLHPSSGC